MPHPRTFFLTAAVCVLFLTVHGFGQNKTIILVRHAEKQTGTSADPNDPDLSPEGRVRAEALARRIKGYRVGAVYSTNFRRTRETAEPSAMRRKKIVKFYDAKDQGALISEIMGSKTKRFLIVGHSNTIPPLANLLIRKDIFKNLEEQEFGVIWVVRLRGGKPPEVKILTY